MVTITLESLSSLDLLTPETTLARATDLNNAFQLLWRNATAAQKKRLNPVIDGYVTYYNKLKNNLVVRLTEYGELEQWEAKYQQIRDQFEREGINVTAPVIVAGQSAGSYKVATPDISKATEKAQETSDDITKAMYVVGGIAAVLFVWYLLKKK